jgi:hypothetical protein
VQLGGVDAAQHPTRVDPPGGAGHVGAMFNARSQAIEDCLPRLEADRVGDYCPAFLTSADKPSQAGARSWVK